MDDKRVFIAYRFQKLQDALAEVQDNARLGHWSLGANRLYDDSQK